MRDELKERLRRRLAGQGRTGKRPEQCALTEHINFYPGLSLGFTLIIFFFDSAWGSFVTQTG